MPQLARLLGPLRIRQGMKDNGGKIMACMDLDLSSLRALSRDIPGLVMKLFKPCVS